jgi:hypothetical protein
VTEAPPATPSSEVHENADRGTSAVGLGAVLVIVGLLLFVGQLTNVGIDDVGWPLIIVAIGVVLLALGLFVNNEQGMVVGGTVVTTIGLVLLYQNETGHWASWAYAWALVGPAASGLGLVLWGVRNGNGGDVRNGTWGLLGGLAIFVVGYLFFEGVIGLSGERLPLPEWVLPAAVIVIGVAVLLRGLMERREPDSAT